MALLDGIRSIEELELAGKRVFIRVDFNVPLDKKTGQITDDTRITEVLPTIKHAVEAGAKVVLAAHFGRPKGKPVPEFSLEPVAQHLAKITGWEVLLSDSEVAGDLAKKLVSELKKGQVVLLENLRFRAEEEANDPAFAKQLAELCDVYVNDAFGAAHRAHASTAGMAAFVREKAAGFLMKKELAGLARVTEAPAKPFIAILGGAKVSDKTPVIESLSKLCDTICIGGAMANTLLESQGKDMKKSLVEKDIVSQAAELLAQAKARGVEILIPVDVVVAASIDAKEGQVVAVDAVPDGMLALDIGPETVKLFSAKLSAAKTVFWNGPMGLFENDAFAAGTNGVAQALAASEAYTVIGGGDSAAAVRKAGLEDKMSFISTGGGASLELVEGQALPGIEALRG